MLKHVFLKSCPLQLCALPVPPDGAGPTATMSPCWEELVWTPNEQENGNNTGREKSSPVKSTRVFRIGSDISPLF